MIKKLDHPKTCAELLDEYLAKKTTESLHPEKIKFAGVGDKDVYNITAPFDDQGDLVIAGRVESRDSEQSQVYFFVQKGDEWVPRNDTPVFDLQDPFVTKVGENIVIGGVQTFPHPSIEGALGWRTVFYKGVTMGELNYFAKGPDGMKDLRLVELSDGTIGIFTRPQGDKGGRGKIGYDQVQSLDDLTLNIIESAPLLTDQFVDGEWGGANELHLLSNGLIGVLGHIASFDKKGDRHYYPITFIFDPITKTYSDMSLLATRQDFLPGATKRPDLVDVVFSGGLIRKPDGSADFYAGISDAEAQKITINDPFKQYEK